MTNRLPAARYSVINGAFKDNPEIKHHHLQEADKLISKQNETYDRNRISPFRRLQKKKPPTWTVK